MDDLSHAYQVLGIKPGTAPDEAKRIYRDLVQVWHPDRFGHDERLRHVAQEKLKEINGAYKILEAHFFQAAIQPEAPALEAAPPASEAPEPVPTIPASRNKTLIVALIGTLVLVSAIGATIWRARLKTRTAIAPASVPVAKTPPTFPQYALSFDGNQSHILINTTGALSNTFTVECWTLTRRPNTVGTVLCSRGPKDFSFDIKFRQGKRFHADIGDGSQWIVRNFNAPILYKRNTWYHLAYVVTPTGCTAYVNGKNLQSTTFPSPSNPILYDSNHQLSLGADLKDLDYLDGCIAEVRVWNLARTETEIKRNMNTSLTGHEPGLQGYWPFKEGSGTNIADASGHGFTATFVSFISWSTNLPPHFTAQ